VVQQTLGVSILDRLKRISMQEWMPTQSETMCFQIRMITARRQRCYVWKTLKIAWWSGLAPPSYMEVMGTLARGLNIKSHVDGARIFNAAVAQNVSVKDLCKAYSSIASNSVPDPLPDFFVLLPTPASRASRAPWPCPTELARDIASALLDSCVLLPA
jgi:hypothetical protein